MATTMRFHKLADIARDSLQSCYADGKVLASPKRYSDFWARDTFWALPGMLVAGDYERARVCLTYFLDHQRADGKIARKFSRDINVIKYLCGVRITRTVPRPTYHGLIRPFHAVDSELLLLIAMEAYLDETRDYDLAEAYYGHVKKAIGWHMTRAKDSLIHEYFLGSWMDTVFTFGPVLYSNALYVRALEAMVTIAQVAGNDDDAQVYVIHARRAKRAVREHFWRGTHFAGKKLLKRRATFDLAGNAMALLWGIADTTQRDTVLTHFTHIHNQHGAWMPAVPTGQPFWKVNPLAHLFRIGDYHTRASWPWITGLVAQVFHVHGERDRAHAILADMERVAKRDGTLGETYMAGGMPYKKLLWRSAAPFAWSSGVLLHTLLITGHTTNAVDYKKPEPRIC